MASSKPVRIWFDYKHFEYWHRLELERLITAMSAGGSSEAVSVDDRGQADCVVRMGGSPSLGHDSLFKSLHLDQAKSPPEFIWDYSDLPTGTFPGFYASLPSYIYDHKRHRAFSIPLVCNELVRPYDPQDATFLYGFFGAISSGVRARMVPLLNAHPRRAEGLIEVRDSIWNQMFDRSGLQPKLDYTENLRRSRFILCPRGSVLAGAGSRLYETMQAARVPVLISDWITLPEGVDWDACSVRIKERDLARIPEILDSYSDRWVQMAANARRSWESHFSNESLLDELGRQLKGLLSTYAEDDPWVRLSSRCRIALGYAAYSPRLGYRRLQDLKARGRRALSKA